MIDLNTKFGHRGLLYLPNISKDREQHADVRGISFASISGLSIIIPSSKVVPTSNLQLIGSSLQQLTMLLHIQLRADY